MSGAPTAGPLADGQRRRRLRRAALVSPSPAPALTGPEKGGPSRAASGAEAGEIEENREAANPGLAEIMSGPTFAQKTLKTLRGFIESGQAQFGADRSNGITDPFRARAPRDPGAEAAPQPAAMLGETRGPPAAAAQQGATAWLTRGRAQRLAGTEPESGSEADEPSPRALHEARAREAWEQKQQQQIAERARHEKERKDKLMRYIILIICFVAIIVGLLAMAAISRKVLGKWWHGQPDPTPPSDTAISHGVNLPHANSI
jgi:hypothetical protein